MEVSRKKIIAREFLILIGCLVVSILAYIGTFPYNYVINSNIENIEEKIKSKNKKIDGLEKAYISKIEKQKWFFNEFVDHYRTNFLSLKGNNDDVGDELDILFDIIKDNELDGGVNKSDFRKRFINDTDAPNKIYTLLERNNLTGSKTKDGFVSFFSKMQDKELQQLTEKINQNGNAGGQDILSSLSDILKHSQPVGENGKSKYKVLWTIFSEFQKSDSIVFMWDNIFPQHLIKTMKGIGFESGKDFNHFISKYSLDKQERTDKETVNEFRKNVLSLKKQSKYKENRLLDSEGKIHFGLIFLAVLLIISFPVRYLIYSIRWSVKTLKQ